MKRKIKSVFNADKINMDGFIVDQPLPNGRLDTLDPFLLIHHADQLFRGNRKPMEAGVGPHPHRGFSPVTFVFQGQVHHRDSRGNNAIVSAGGMQWMNAGMGIIHSERPTAQMADEGGRMEIVQVWVNSPSQNKMDQPYYLPIHEESLTKIERDNGKVVIRLYAGRLEDHFGPAAVQFPVSMMRFDFEEGGEYRYEALADENVLVYVLKGSVEINGHSVVRKQLVVFEKEQGDISLVAKDTTQLILMSGKPLNEPVVKYGPYVMNTQTQIMEAMRDYQMGKMGVLIEEFDS